MKYYDLNDYELLFMVNEQNEDAKDILYTKYYAFIKSIVLKYQRAANVLNVDINELYQESLIAFYDAIDNYDDEYYISFSSFLKMCIERRFNKIIRKHNNDKHKVFVNYISIEDTDEYYIGKYLSDYNNNPAVILDNKEILDCIFDLLSPEERELVNLLADGLSTKEIAKVYNKNYKNMYNKIYKLKHKIKTFYDKFDTM